MLRSNKVATVSLNVRMPSVNSYLSFSDKIEPVEDLFTRVTLDIIGVSLVGKELRRFRSKTSPLSFEQCYNGILAQPIAGQIISFINPFIPLRWLPVSANLNFIKAKSALKSMMAELIEQRTSEVAKAKELATDSGLSDDLLTRMIEASSVENQKLSRDELIDIVRDCPEHWYIANWCYRLCRSSRRDMRLQQVPSSGQHTPFPKTKGHKNG
jgi:hypothetical protein